MKKRFFAVMLAAVMMTGLVACGGGQSREQQAAQQAPAAAPAASGAPASRRTRKDPYTEPTKIAYVAHDLSTANNQGWKEGIERECAPYSNITVDSFNGESSAEKQVQIMDDLINQKYDAIILQCSDGTALAPSVIKAEEAGIPVITLNLNAECTHAAWVMAVDYDGGRLVADEMAKELGGKGKVAVMRGNVAVSRENELFRGFQETITNNYPDIEILDTQSAAFEKDQAITVMNSYLQNYPDLDGVFCLNDPMAEGAALACEAAGKKGQIIIWGDDGEKAALEMIESGDITGTIYTHSWDEGITCAQVALMFINSEYDSNVLSDTPKIIMEPKVVTIENVGEIGPEDRW